MANITSYPSLPVIRKGRDKWRSTTHTKRNSEMLTKSFPLAIAKESGEWPLHSVFGFALCIKRRWITSLACCVGRCRKRWNEIIIMLTFKCNIYVTIMNKMSSIKHVQAFHLSYDPIAKIYLHFLMAKNPKYGSVIHKPLHQITKSH